VTFQLRVYGLPVPKAAPQATMVGGHAVVYTKKKDRAWKETVKQQVIEAVERRGLSPWLGALKLDLVFYLARPVSLPKRVYHHIKKPDCDNLAKTVKDALKGLIYKDDSQVVLLAVRKLYDERPGVAILAEFWEEPAPRPKSQNVEVPDW
jgi:Holliday junction resolvase RusA-like endonuclease